MIIGGKRPYIFKIIYQTTYHCISLATKYVFNNRIQIKIKYRLKNNNTIL